MPCIECHEDKKLVARGLCATCYYRLRRNGTVQRTNAVNFGQKCLVVGCIENAFAKGLCPTHYNKAQHPLRTTWKLLRSRAGAGQYPKGWEDFEAFLADVGERPSPKHQLRRSDTKAPWSVENLHWVVPVSAAAKRGWKDDAHTEYMRAWNFRRRFGLEPDVYADMVEKQAGKCAACGKPETQLAYRTGKVQALAVDHNHTTGAVRGLLCRRCNVVIGLVEETSETLQAIDAYLGRYRPTHEAPG